ncbi:enolase C-terminal domain-like protein [Breznakiella homolactica]|uniref:Glucarate dehydratase n=1 Tax=Breznakiella homolactica TaxID=2798577 RepID=A0A7T7XLD7_9SPIR|nr:enolase C-terminal domain-like protein [Breznakiella homolactica]QQO08506.1 glucarate dehydratase [Breznakiella homolactica]
MKSSSPVITDMKVVPVAGYDSMLMTLSGAHAPVFTRNLVILTDNSGNTGIGEVHGGESFRRTLESYIPKVVGREIADYRNILLSLRNPAFSKNSGGEGLQGLDLAKLKFVVKADTALECALLDLLGKYVNLPICSLLGEGKQRDEITVLGYLFYVSDGSKTDLDYIDEDSSGDEWFRLRRKPMLTPEQIVEQARAVQNKYGVRDFKLKGGVFRGNDEMEAVRAIKKEFPDARVNIDPNGAWSLREAVELCIGVKDILTYAEDPCGPESGYSSREIMSEFKMLTGIPVATNMIATDWRQLHHSVVSKAVDIVLADPHFWLMNGSVRCGQLLSDWNMTWGCHSNNHFDISLAIFAQTAAACPGDITAMDTHWIWQDGQDLCDDAMKIIDGKIRIPDKPGLGISINMDKVMKAHELYRKLDNPDRDDAKAMQYLIPGWKFDPKKPCLIRE